MKKLYILALLVAFLVSAAVADDDPPPRGKPATVTIITNPPNSEVYLGNELLGKSPIENMQVQSGRQTLIVIDQGYELVNQRVNVWPGKDKRNTFECLIYVDGENSDKTDGAALTIHNLDAGDHLVRAECSNRKSAEMLVTVKGEETVKITLDASGKKKKK